MDQHVAKNTARFFDVFGRWRAGVAAGDDQHFGVADVARRKASAGLIEGRVEAALKTDHAGHASGLDRLGAGLGARDGEVHRLLAKNMLTRSGGAGDQVAVGRCRRANGDGVDLLVGQNRLNRGDFCAQ